MERGGINFGRDEQMCKRDGSESGREKYLTIG